MGKGRKKDSLRLKEDCSLFFPFSEKEKNLLEYDMEAFDCFFQFFSREYKHSFSFFMFTLPGLPFAPDALSGFCSSETFAYHHGKHHATYVNKLNDAIGGTKWEKMTEANFSEIIPQSFAEKNMAVFNNAAQHFNHSFFWNCLTPQGPGHPTPAFLSRIEAHFGSFSGFQEQFEAAAISLFGSGWVFLVEDLQGVLSIEKYPNADTPIMTGKNPLLTLDVWEHAYYIDFRNARAQFASSFWKYLHWSFVESQSTKSS